MNQLMQKSFPVTSYLIRFNSWAYYESDDGLWGNQTRRVVSSFSLLDSSRRGEHTPVFYLSKSKRCIETINTQMIVMPNSLRTSQWIDGRTDTFPALQTDEKKYIYSNFIFPSSSVFRIVDQLLSFSFVMIVQGQFFWYWQAICIYIRNPLSNGISMPTEIFAPWKSPGCEEHPSLPFNTFKFWMAVTGKRCQWNSSTSRHFDYLKLQRRI